MKLWVSNRHLLRAGNPQLSPSKLECGRREKRAAGANPGKPSERASPRRQRIFSISYSYSNPCWPVLQMAPGSPETSWGWGSTGQTIPGQGIVMCTSVKPSGGKACSSAKMTSSASWSILHFYVMMRYNELAGKTQPWLTPWAAPVTLITELLEMGSPVELHFEENRVCSNPTHLLRSCHSH